MNYKYLGKTELKVSNIGLGTGQFGSVNWGYPAIFGDKDIVRIIQHATNLGINLFDTAEAYSSGKAEELLGTALSKSDRDDLVIISKVAPWNLTYKGVMRAVERSLRRLRTNTIDLYLVHYPNPFLSMRETFRALEELVRIGKIRYVGVSNFSNCMVRKAQESLPSVEIVVDEIEYNILSRRAEKETIPYCIQQNISIIAFSPLAGGILTDKYYPIALPRDRARAFNFRAQTSFVVRAYPLLKTLKEIADQRNASIAQVSLSWIVNHPSCIAIPAALSIEELEDNAKASNLELSRAEINTINKTAVSLGLRDHILDNYVIRPIGWTKATIANFLSLFANQQKNLDVLKKDDKESA